jgi:crossover junction endodeoxyribonuclease RuvC
MTLALGIDPGTATTGYGLVRLAPDGELVAVKYGVILTPKDASAPARLEMIYDGMRDLIRNTSPRPPRSKNCFSRVMSPPPSRWDRRAAW